jgi:hypothetical protein
MLWEALSLNWRLKELPEFKDCRCSGRSFLRPLFCFFPFID